MAMSDCCERGVSLVGCAAGGGFGSCFLKIWPVGEANFGLASFLFSAAVTVSGVVATVFGVFVGTECLGCLKLDGNFVGGFEILVVLLLPFVCSNSRFFLLAGGRGNAP